MLVDVVSGRLLPSLRVGHDEIDMAAHDFEGFTTGPVIYVGSGTLAARGFVAWNFWGFALRSVWPNRFQKFFHQPAIIRREEKVDEVGRGTHFNFFSQISRHNICQLREQNVSRHLAMWLCYVLAGNPLREIKHQFLNAPALPELFQVN